jgi:hypothetical protein
LPDSLPNAITEPENVIAPTKLPMKSSRRLPVGIGWPLATMLNAQGSATQAMAMNTAARPIMLCMNATSSGILVISTRLAMIVPAPPPTTRPPSTTHAGGETAADPPVAAPAICGASLTISATVVMTAIAMPVMPKTLPRREVVGCDSPLRAWMKQMEATRYSRTTTFRLRLIWALRSTHGWWGLRRPRRSGRWRRRWAWGQASRQTP